MAKYWSGSPEKWNLINKVQEAKRDLGLSGRDAIASDEYVLVNPVTGKEPSAADLRYALSHLSELYESGAIRDDRWAFLWYHG